MTDTTDRPIRAFSDEHRAKLRQAALERAPMSSETREKIAVTMRERALLVVRGPKSRLKSAGALPS